VTGLRRERWKTAVSYAVIIVMACFAFFPLYWMLSSGTKPYADLFARPPQFFPRTIDFQYYLKVFQYTDFLVYLKNSLITAIASTAISVVIACMAAYSISRREFRFKKLAGRSVLLAYIFPPILLVIPLFQTINAIGLAGNRFGLILTYITFSFPYSTWLLLSYFKSIPYSLVEAAKIDGALNIRIFTSIILPLTKPAIVTATIYTFINAWNELLYAMVIASSDNLKTLPVGLYAQIGGEMTEWGVVLAWSSMITLPSMIFFLLVNKQIVRGLTAGAIKG
jgi:ABC-type glycerol-3-phosphate transport system permease component